jgi:mannose-6-phosphate isomerase-like protein (cupin superfamily)
MKKLALGLFCAVLLCAVFGTASIGGSDGVKLWTNQELTKTIASMSGTGKPSVSKTIGDYGDHSVMVVHREADGQVEVHAKKHDVIVVRDGAGTLVTGGEVIGGKSTAPDEIRGDKVTGGHSVKLNPGDVVYIPAKVPHQVLLAKGQTISYEAIKIPAQ